jgi:hypothetical protein
MAYSEHSKLLAQPRGDAERAVVFIDQRSRGEYETGAIREIVGRYYDTCTDVGLDPFLAVVQMSHETGFLSSFWSQRPRRNPAGIGVTGAPGVGISFPSWKQAINAHVGRLLAYAIRAGQGTDAQRALIAEALAVRPLGADKRGVAPVLGGLVPGWAADPRYTHKLVALGNEMLG